MGEIYRRFGSTYFSRFDCKKVLCCAAFSLWRFSVCLIFKQSTNVLNPKCGIAEIASCSKPFLTCCRKAYCPHSSQFGVKTVAVSIPDMPWCCHRIHIGEMILSFPCRSDCHNVGPVCHCFTCHPYCETHISLIRLNVHWKWLHFGVDLTVRVLHCCSRDRLDGGHSVGSCVLRQGILNPLALDSNIYILARHLCKMWIFYEPRRVTLGNTRQFEVE